MLIKVYHLISHINNRKNNFLLLGQGPTEGINDSNHATEKFSINFSKARAKFFLSLHHNGDESHLANLR